MKDEHLKDAFDEKKDHKKRMKESCRREHSDGDKFAIEKSFYNTSPANFLATLASLIFSNSSLSWKYVTVLKIKNILLSKKISTKNATNRLTIQSISVSSLSQNTNEEKTIFN